MKKKYKVTWMTENTAQVVADGSGAAIVTAIRNTADGNIESAVFPIICVTDVHTENMTVVAIDQECKVVKVHELD